MITYTTEAEIDVDAMIDVYRDSGLGERRPVDDRERMSGMLADANLIVTAWDGERLVGISRCVTDWVYCNYLSDLAVRLEYQNHGIGKELVRLSREATPQATAQIGWSAAVLRAPIYSLAVAASQPATAASRKAPYVESTAPADASRCQRTQASASPAPSISAAPPATTKTPLLTG